MTDNAVIVFTPRVCSDHYLSSDFMIMMHRLLKYCPMKTRILKPDAAPTENLQPVILSSILSKSLIKSNCFILPQSVRKTGLFKVDVVRKMIAQNKSLPQKEKISYERTTEDYQAEINELKDKLETAIKIIHIYQREMNIKHHTEKE